MGGQEGQRAAFGLRPAVSHDFPTCAAREHRASNGGGGASSAGVIFHLRLHITSTCVLQSLLRHARTVRMPHNGEPSCVRVGIHTGALWKCEDHYQSHLCPQNARQHGTGPLRRGGPRKGLTNESKPNRKEKTRAKTNPRLQSTVPGSFLSKGKRVVES